MNIILKPLNRWLLVVTYLFIGNTAVQAQHYDLDTGNTANDFININVGEAVQQTVSATAGDASLILRMTAILSNAWFDATAPYHESAIGVYSDLGRRPKEESETNRFINIALMHSSYRVLKSLLPEHNERWYKMMLSAGLDPDNSTSDKSSPVGLGNLAGQAIVDARERDGMNQLGDEGGRKYNPLPYADYTGYKPVNTVYKLRNPSRWQPSFTRKSHGLFSIQQFVTPQLRYVTPYSYDDPSIFRAPFPIGSQVWNFGAYKQQADEVLEISANLSDEQKMKAELFDNKFLSLGTASVVASEAMELSLMEYIHFEFMLNIAAFDTSIAIWNEKYRYDAVRPFSAISFIYKDSPITAWGGPGMGTVNDLPAVHWKSYLNVADHPEYPSATASFCAAHAAIARRYLETDQLDWLVPYNRGSSSVEPKLTPTQGGVIEFQSWTQFESDCGESRIWGGVHFRPSVAAGQSIGRQVANYAYDFALKHIKGDVE